ncbi:flagellar hook-length control protein FliK [Ruixingdingia sedimenti]|uniref:Flagellar hook-length control protein FliK n=1 Tax=Ruixingdingia sedimenti TaxID=3073604 RepID=A0ABU1F757_9RHOB|nr:flagellar hook-length control protein FliK [Xinfangfangia sp. LG-4]MDR5652698.1 flagellar hook-length control protein FliK [Xinfangfangia sp. LG-4]
MAWFDIPAGAVQGVARGVAAPAAGGEGGGDFAALMAGAAPGFAVLSPAFGRGAFQTRIGPAEEQADSSGAEGAEILPGTAIPWPSPPDPLRANVQKGGQAAPAEGAIGLDSSDTETVLFTQTPTAPPQPAEPDLPHIGPASLETSLAAFPGASLRFIRPLHAAPPPVVEFVPMDDPAMPSLPESDSPVLDTVMVPGVGEQAGADQGPVPLADTASSPAAAPRPTSAGTMPAAAPPAPLPALRRIAEAAQQGDGVVELRLDPPELGTLRLMLMPEGDTIRATIHADRPETLDLLRRNAAELAAEFRAAGFGGAVLDFGAPGFAGGRGGDQPPRDDSPPPAPPAMAAAQTPAPTRASGLDLRL